MTAAAMTTDQARRRTSSDPDLLDIGQLEAQKLLGGGDDVGPESPTTAALLDGRQQNTSGDHVGVVSSDTNYEYGVSARLKLAFLLIYLALNMGLTLHSKSILQQIHCPWSLTTLHATFSSLGCGALFATGRLRLTQLNTRDNLLLLAFSFLFTINIAISVVSLSMVSVPLHQTIRASTPLFTVAAYRLLFGREYSFWTQVSLFPIVIGVCFATYGDIDFTPIGLSLTFLGVLLATAKTITTNRLLTGSLKLPALELLLRMSPLAAMQACAFAFIAGEGKVVADLIMEKKIPMSMYLALIANGCIALLLNITSFQTNKLAGALTLTVSANVKQCLTILVGIFLFNVHTNLMNGLGMAITAAGAAWFSCVELRNKQTKATLASNLPLHETEKLPPTASAPQREEIVPA